MTLATISSRKIHALFWGVLLLSACGNSKVDPVRSVNAHLRCHGSPARMEIVVRTVSGQKRHATVSEFGSKSGGARACHDAVDHSEITFRKRGSDGTTVFEIATDSIGSRPAQSRYLYFVEGEMPIVTSVAPTEVDWVAETQIAVADIDESAESVCLSGRIDEFSRLKIRNYRLEVLSLLHAGHITNAIAHAAIANFGNAALSALADGIASPSEVCEDRPDELFPTPDADDDGSEKPDVAALDPDLRSRLTSYVIETLATASNDRERATQAANAFKLGKRLGMNLAAYREPGAAVSHAPRPTTRAR